MIKYCVVQHKRGMVLVLIVLLSTLSCRNDAIKKQHGVAIAVPYEIDTLDPHVRNSLSTFALLSHFYEPLVTTDADMRIQPCLAVSWENPDLLTWIFYLRSPVRFHDGKILDSGDVVYSYQRLLQSQKLEMAGYLLDITEVTAQGPLAVRIRTKHPMNVLLNKLRFVEIVPRNADTETISKKVDGTGPYSLPQWNDKSVLQMVRNDRYWGKKPFFEHVLFRLNQTSEQAIQSLVSGRSQLVQCNSKKVEGITGNGKKIKAVRKDSLFLKYIGYDLERDRTPFCDAASNPFKNQLVREAIRAGLDTRSLVSRLTTYAVPASQPLPPIVFGFNPQISQASYDPSLAVSLLQQAGYPNGFHVTLHVRQQFGEAAAIVKEQLARIGIRIDVQALDDNTILPGLRKHQYSFFLSRIGCPTGDASDILDNCFHSVDSERHYGVMNYGLFANPEMDRAIEESAGIQSIDRRRDAIQNIMSRVTKEVVWVPLYIDQDVYAMDSSLSWQPRSDSFVLASEISASH